MVCSTSTIKLSSQCDMWFQINYPMSQQLSCENIKIYDIWQGGSQLIQWALFNVRGRKNIKRWIDLIMDQI